ncbi:hypothetical protein OO006_11200 [Prosthecochloris sp. SCSIO W1101]|uniref:hypothetical protein n=1 Tax=Prosthecochloris sp. SCSIO W1101 TaxID=2992242 RepID=UPI00223E11B6|nr:hypothetical protein [Prosthecochloris sp. SCSIO W1101]UZJ40909.1 hypothetical protein OO006_11200 [Prosthecochloris sp. SCSIO W1101]
MDPRVALRLHEDYRGRRAMLENGWAKGVKLDVKWHPIPHESHAALDAASMQINEVGDGSTGRASLARG